jgi:hypothetical protein
MNPNRLSLGLLLSAFMFCAGSVFAQEDATPASTPEEREAFYTQTIEHRVEDILKALALKDAAKASRVHDAIILQYRSLRTRDAAIGAKLKESGNTNADSAARAALAGSLSKPLHEWFLSVLALDLTPEQVDAVKDQMTYNKVKVTFDAYCNIVPNLTEADKTKIKDLLTAAREEAMDGGSAGEKSAVFQKYKDQINGYLNANGHDVAKAYKDWEAKQPVQQADAKSTTPPVSPAK